MHKIKDIFLINTIYQDQYNQKIEKGIEYLKNSKIVIVGLCRNLEKRIISNLEKINTLLDNKCLEYKIILFENDSIDNTKEHISNYQQQNKNIILLSENYNRPHFGSIKNNKRTEALAEYRNNLKKYVQQNYSDFDFTIMMDLDFSDLSIEGIYNSFGWLKEFNTIGGMAGNNFEIKSIFDNTPPMIWNYDSWAFRGSWWEDLDYQPKNTFNQYNSMFWFGMWVLPIGSQPVTINSAFGGCCIYRNEFFLSGNYNGQDCEHVTFHYSIKNNNPNFQLFLNPSQIMLA